MQAFVIPRPVEQVTIYLTLWIVVAAASVAIVGVELTTRYLRATSELERQKICRAVEQFAPCVIAGAAVTWVLTGFETSAVELLPGIWSVLFSLGVFASWRQLPPASFWIGVFYLAAGLVCLAWARESYALSPWAMAGSFGVGQALTAGVLFFSLDATMARRSTKNEPTAPAGTAARYAYDGLQRAIHEKARLGIMTSLVTHAAGLSFNDLKSLCGLTDGNLNRHLEVLREAGLVAIRKETAERRPQTFCRVTARGRTEFLAYLAELERVVADAAQAAQTARGAERRWSTA